ncbi:Levodione reductase 1 [Colletotrichum plurivorum]|uniref:Levodione reductase 1 n=1 Tax=Colletotrichum plurivorum TaxID=2175906 RepID=A0A8H6N6B2_9PEZI|nr:Levodione reductase 1 [Colletotrichum plurivorum]
MPSFQGNVFAVTGAASGIGLATAKAIAARGGIVCVADLNKASLEEAQVFFSSRSPSVDFMISAVDVSNKEQVQDWFKAIIAKFGRLDGAANIAGVIGRGHGIKSIAELEDDEWNKIIGVNLTGTMYCLREELRIIKDGGSIVNMASIHATTGACVANHGAYAASKHGVLGMTRVAAKEVGDREIRVNAVAPGPIYTPMMQKYWDAVDRPADAPFDEPIAFRRQGTAEEVANVVVFLLGPDSSFVSGSCYSVDGAWI